MTKLNPLQEKAVQTLSGPILVIAGPGTGKTTVLTQRIVQILSKTDTKPWQILALTFSESAQINMKRRLFKLIKDAAYQVNIFTFHGFAKHVIEQFPDYFLEIQDFEILDEITRFLILKEIIENNSHKLTHITGYTNPLSNLKRIAATIENLKREGITLEKLKKIISTEEELLTQTPKHSKRSKSGFTTKYLNQKRLVEKLKETYLIYKNYEQKLKEYRRLDFNDLINIVNLKFKQNQDLALNIQERYEYILVDEYQDTNTAQNELLFNLISFWKENPNIFVVGDDDQAIYRFQGASVENIKDFVNTFNNRTDIVLNYNYRSTQLILDAAANIRQKLNYSISELLPHLNKNLISANPRYKNKQNPKIKIGKFVGETAELTFLADTIKKLHKKGIAYEDIAVLVRRNYQADIIAKFLYKAGIPFNKSSNQNLLDNPYVLQLLNILRFIADPGRADLLNRILLYPFWQIDHITQVKVLQNINEFLKEILDGRLPLKQTIQQLSFTGLKDKSIETNLPLDAIKEIIRKTKLGTAQQSQLLDIIDLLARWVALSATLNVARLIEHIISDTKLIDYILKQPTKYEDLSAINSFVGYIRAIIGNNPNLTLNELLEIIDLIQDFNITLPAENIFIPKKGVNILTVHAAKGLEFEVVLMPQLTYNLWKPDIRPNMVIPRLLYLNRRFDLKDKTLIAKLKKLRKEEINSPQKHTNWLKLLAQDDNRRLFYVALTRAKKLVFLTYSEFAVNYNGKPQEQLVASFIKDIPKDLTEVLNTDSYNLITDTVPIRNLFKPSDLANFYISSADENEYLKTYLLRFKLSPSALVAYLRDPQEFYLNYFLKTPRPTSIWQIYGNAFHLSIRKYLERIRAKETPFEFDQLLEIFMQELKKRFLTPEELNRLLKRAKLELKVYYDQRLKNFPNYPLFIEKIAESSLKGYPLKGIIDRVESIDYEKGYVRIVDVKTSRYRSLNELLGNTQNSEKLANFGSDYLIQLYFYKLLFELDSRLHRNRHYIPIKAAIDFTRPASKDVPQLHAPVEIEFETVKYEEFKQLLLNVLDEIYSLKFIQKKS